MSTTPEEYFGPHAKRWTSPTGQVFSLQPADYERMVNTQMELDFNARLLEEMEDELQPVPDHEPERPRDDIIEPDTKMSWPNVISMDTAYDRVDPETAMLFKEPGIILTKGQIRTATLSPDGWQPRPVLAEGDHIQVVKAGKVLHFTLNADGSIAEIHPFPDSEAGEPAARHLKPRRWPRIAAALGLLVIITIIGVAAAAGMVS